MTALALERSATRTRLGDEGRPGEQAAPSLFDGLGGEPTLDELIAGVWEGLAAHRAVACPMCGGELAPAYGAHALPIGGRCRGCGSTVS